MIRFSSRQRAALGETLRDLANFAATALVFGQLVGQGVVSWSLFIAGTVFWFLVVWLEIRCGRRSADARWTCFSGQRFRPDRLARAPQGQAVA